MKDLLSVVSQEWTNCSPHAFEVKPIEAARQIPTIARIAHLFFFCISPLPFWLHYKTQGMRGQTLCG